MRSVAVDGLAAVGRVDGCVTVEVLLSTGATGSVGDGCFGAVGVVTTSLGACVTASSPAKTPFKFNLNDDQKQN